MTEPENLPQIPYGGDRPPRGSYLKEGMGSTLSTIGILLTAPLIAILLTLFVFQSYQVDGHSMETTLSDNDRLIVWKLPRTWSRITGEDYVPARGDVVVFKEPAISQYGQDPDKQLIKRVVALPGETVVVSDGKLIVFNEENPGGFEPDRTLPYGDVIPSTPLDGNWTVGTHQIFVAGDNRGNSLDSRSFGPLDLDKVVGKLSVRVLPLSKMEKF